MWTTLDLKLLEHKTYHRATDEERVYQCPECGKWKLYVNIAKHTFICFVCNVGGRVRGVPGGQLVARQLREKKQNDFVVPRYRMLTRNAEDYLQSRGITRDIIDTFSLVEGIEGPWIHRVIVPIIRNGEWVYCLGRTYQARDNRGRYYYPPGVPRKDKTFDTNPGQEFGWRFIVEGWSDAVRLWQVGWPATALLGNSLSDAQKHEILDTTTKGVVVCLDPFAWTKAIQIAEKLTPYLEVRTHFMARGDLGDAPPDRLAEVTSIIEERDL